MRAPVMVRAVFLAGAISALGPHAFAQTPQSYDLIATAPFPEPDGTVQASGVCVGRALWDGVSPFAPSGVRTVLDAAQTTPCYQPVVASSTLAQSAPQLSVVSGVLTQTFPDGSAQAVSGLATTTALNALSAAMPTPLTTIPPAPTQTGTAGSGSVYVPANAAPPSLTRSTTAITASDGTVSITWTNPLVSATPPVSIIPINTGTQPVICNVTARTASTVAGKCWQIVSTTLSLAIVTAGLNLNPATSAAAGMSVMIVAREPSP